MNKRLPLLLVTLVALTSCISLPESSQRKPTATDVPPLVLTQTAEAEYQQLHNHEGAIRFMSWNVFGGGAIGDAVSLNEGRIPLILDVIKRSNPDVLLIQEANNWTRGEPQYAQLIANEIGMENYVYCKSLRPASKSAEDGNSFDNVIFTGFDILESEIYDIIDWCALYARIALPGGQEIHVFTTHIAGNNELRCNEPQIRPLSEISGEYTSNIGVLMGDFNILDGYVEGQIPREVCFDLLSDAGWNLIHQEGVDLIFLSQGLLDLGIEYQALSNMDNPLFDPLIDPKKGIVASDHEPVIVDVFFP